MMLFAAILCGALLVAVTATFLFSSTFRRDVIAGESEAAILGILNAKGATVVVVMALFTGGVLYSSARSSVKLERLDSKVMKEVPGLAERMGRDMEALHQSHQALIHAYFDKERQRVEAFMRDEWLPEFSRNMVKDPEVRRRLASVLIERTEAPLLDEFSQFNTAQQQRLLEERESLLAPITEAEQRMLHDESTFYESALSRSAALSELLRSLR